MTSNTLSSVASSTSSVQLLPANRKRQHVIIQNESTAVLYVAFDTAASLTSYSFQIPAGGYVNINPIAHTGTIFGIWAAANGSARCTDI